MLPMPIIRHATVADAARLAAIYAPAVTDGATSFEAVPPDAAEMARRVAAVTSRLPWLVAADGDAVLGYAYAGLHRERTAYQWSVEVSVYVAAAAHRRGLGRALYTSLFAVLAELGYVNAYAGITLPNPGSVGFHTAFGFTPVGTYHAIGFKHGRWHDVLWLERMIVPRPEAPGQPRALEAVAGEPRVERAVCTGAPLIGRRKDGGGVADPAGTESIRGGPDGQARTPTGEAL